MARDTSNFVLGLFVTVGFAIIVVAVVWIGASRYFDQGKLYITYFNESVQGLQKDAEVKFRGVTVGRVDQIRIAPDNRLIGVVMSLSVKQDLTRDVVAQLQVTGITGLMFINLDYRKPEAPDLSPSFNFVTEYPVIPSRPSELQRILADVSEVLNKLKEIDTVGIANQLKAALTEIDALFKSPAVKNILANAQSTTANLKDFTSQLNNKGAAGNVSQVLKETQAALTAAKTLFATLQQDIAALRLPEIGSQTTEALGQVNGIAAKLRQTSDALDNLVNRLSDRPPDLFFGKPPQGRWNE